ncbi:MAG: hypothetical protein ACK4VW_01175 [Anaerolineales bacterium]
MGRKNFFRVLIKRAFNSLLADVLEAESKNILRARQKLALQQSVAYIEENLPNVVSFDNRYSLIEYMG